MKATSIALCRVSTAKQRLEGNSLEAQEKRVCDAAAYVGANIEKFWSLNISSRKGKNFKRRDLHEMLAYAKQYKRVQYVIVDEVDRFMRSVDEFYYWKVRFREEAGARLVYAAKPGLTFKDDIYALFEEMIDVFRAETSNVERIVKTTEKMKARVVAGYYPGVPKQGYQRTTTPGLHKPREPQWNMLKVAFGEVASQEYTLQEALKRLQARGYKTTRGSDLDMERFKTILLDPYYAGVCQMSTWPPNPHGLHIAMITLEQHEKLKEIVAGKKKIAHKRFNPKYCLSNLLDCTECLTDENAHFPRVVGYDHHNGKQGEKRKHYEKYRCRSCNKEHTRSYVHNEISSVLERLELAPRKRAEFIAALRTVWEQEHQDNARFIQALEQRLHELVTNKNSLVMAIATGKVMEADGNTALEGIKSDIDKVNDEIADAQSIEQDFVEFVEFTMNFIDEMQRNWWELDQKHLGWCKQLLFPEGFSISRDGKVYTPKISEFYRLATIEKGSEEPSFSQMVTHTVKKVYTRS
jgi:site-specific DNA recombinase